MCDCACRCGLVKRGRERRKSACARRWREVEQSWLHAILFPIPQSLVSELRPICHPLFFFLYQKCNILYMACNNPNQPQESINNTASSSTHIKGHAGPYDTYRVINFHAIYIVYAQTKLSYFESLGATSVLPDDPLIPMHAGRLSVVTLLVTAV